MHKRRLSKMGKTSLGVSVPKKWLAKQSINGQKIVGVFVEEVDNKLILSACFKLKDRKPPTKRQASPPPVVPDRFLEEPQVNENDAIQPPVPTPPQKRVYTPAELAKKYG